MTNSPDPIGYAEALAELEGILADLESADVDVDVLAARVQRATQLIGFCRERIGSAKLQIEAAVAGLAETD
ncbi:MAG: exodeoxyribonuclease VII small subunit [Actinomycetota bacterium]